MDPLRSDRTGETPPEATSQGVASRKRPKGRPQGGPKGASSKRYTPREKRTLLEAYAAGGETLGAFCARHHVSTASLCKWRREVAAGGYAALEPRTNPRNTRRQAPRKRYTPSGGHRVHRAGSLRAAIGQRSKIPRRNLLSFRSGPGDAERVPGGSPIGGIGELLGASS